MHAATVHPPSPLTQTTPQPNNVTAGRLEQTRTPDALSSHSQYHAHTTRQQTKQHALFCVAVAHGQPNRTPVFNLSATITRPRWSLPMPTVLLVLCQTCIPYTCIIVRHPSWASYRKVNVPNDLRQCVSCNAGNH